MPLVQAFEGYPLSPLKSPKVFKIDNISVDPGLYPGLDLGSILVEMDLK